MIRFHLPSVLADALAQARAGWRVARGTERLFARDAGLWTGRGEERWLGWLDAPETALAWSALWRELAQEADREGIQDVLLLGMGGSSLGAEVVFRVLGPPPARRRLWVLDTTSPDQIRAVASAINLKSSFVVVASKSGTTLEPSLLLAYWLERAREVCPQDWAKRFFAVTDPGSALEAEALAQGFRRVIPGEPTVGGRFSVLSPFGMSVVSLLGYPWEVGVSVALDAGIEARRPQVEENPAVELGLLLGVAVSQGRDKLTLEFAEPWQPLVAWLEQLLAESLGKNGQLLLPVEGEPRLQPSAYRSDRLFVLLGESASLQERIQGLVASGQPVVEIPLNRPEHLFREFYRWEVATAVAGAWLGLNPFDQPDVEAAKEAARQLTRALETSGSFPLEPPHLSEGSWRAWADPGFQEEHRAGGTLSDLLRAHLERLGSGDYLAILAYLPVSEPVAARLRAIRDQLARLTSAAVTVGFGPRYLHSTGQAHKGGANRGVFLMLTADPETDLPVPGRKLSFGQVLEAQARGDYKVLVERNRRVLHLHARGIAHEEALEALEAALPSPGAPGFEARLESKPQVP